MFPKLAKLCRTGGAGYSHDSFYRFKDLYGTGGELALKELSRRKPLPANRVDSQIEQAVISMAVELPTYGQLRVSRVGL